MNRILATWTRAASILFLPLLVIQGLAQAVTLTPVAQWPGGRLTSATTMAVAGDFAFVAGSSLLVLDVHNPTISKEVTAYDDGGEFYDIVLMDHYALVTRRAWDIRPGGAPATGGLRVIDISNPTSLRLVASYDTAADAWGLAVSGARAYLVESGWDSDVGRNVAKLHVLDLTNLAQPQLLGVCELAGTAERVTVSGDYAYVTTGNKGLLIIDVSNPNEPRPVANHPANASGWVPCVTISGHHAFVGYNNDENQSLEALEILDISDPTHPVSVSKAIPGFLRDVKISGHYAYVTGRRLVVLDIRDPSNPIQVHEDADITWLGYNSRIEIVEDLIYSLSAGNGVSFGDLSDPANPRLLGNFGGGAIGIPRGAGVAVSDQHVYLTHRQGGFRVIDISVPNAPKLVGWYASDEDVRDVVVVGGYAYLPVRRRDGLVGGGLHVVDISDPTQPHRVGQIDIGQEAVHLKVAGHFAYLVGGWARRGGLHVIDISEPTNPRRVGWADFDAGSGDGWYWGSVAISGDHAFVGLRDGLRILDISDPAAPVMLRKVAGIPWPQCVVTKDTYAYLVNAVYSDDSYYEFVVLDLIEPADPQRVASLEIRDLFEGTQIELSGTYAYLSAGTGVRVIDISDPTNPRRVGSYGVEDYTIYSLDVAVSDDHLFVADGPRVLEVLKIDLGPENVRLSVELGVGTLFLRWPLDAPGFVPESSPSLTGDPWDPVVGIPTVADGEYELKVPLDGPARFFRLRKP